MVSWAPHEVGCVLACASSDGSVSVLEFKDNSWEHKLQHAHGVGVNAVSWSPAHAPGSLMSAQQQQQGVVRRFVTGGSDCAVKVWEWDGEGGIRLVATLEGHTDWSVHSGSILLLPLPRTYNIIFDDYD